jgi:carbonic anhydrase
MRRLKFSAVGLIAVMAAVSLNACAKKPAEGEHAEAADAHGEAPHGGDGHGAAPSGPQLTHWGYVGEEGPAHWAQLGGEAATCATGVRQSPIDLSGSKHAEAEKITLDYTPSAVTIQNNGHTVVVTPSQGGGVVVDGVVYKLKQFHFHTPSEHAINGHHAAFETHFVHQNAKGDYLVLGVMEEVGAADPMLAPLWAYLPSDPGSALNVPDLLINPRDLMPSTESFYAYAGSLTTPPCTEGVTWMVFTSPLTISADQVSAFERLIGLSARPVQKPNARTILSVN